MEGFLMGITGDSFSDSIPLSPRNEDGADVLLISLSECDIELSYVRASGGQDGERMDEELGDILSGNLDDERYEDSGEEDIDIEGHTMMPDEYENIGVDICPKMTLVEADELANSQNDETMTDFVSNDRIHIVPR